MKKALLCAALLFAVCFNLTNLYALVPGQFTTAVFNEQEYFVNPKFNALAATSDGGYIAGNASSIFKISSNLTVEWARWYSFSGSPFPNISTLVDIEEYSSGQYIAVFNGGNNAGNSLSRTLVVKLDNTGAVLWAHASHIIDYQMAKAMTIRPDGHIIISGTGVTSNITKSFVVELDSTGDMVSNTIFEHSARKVEVNASTRGISNESTILTSFESINNYADALVNKLDSSGAITSSTSLEVAQFFNVKYKDIIKSSDGDYVLLGRTSSGQIVLIKVSDDLSTVKWAYSYYNSGLTYNGAESPQKVIETPQGFIVGGGSPEYSANSGNTVNFILAVSSSGAMQWAQVTYRPHASYIFQGLALNNSGSKFAFSAQYTPSVLENNPPHGGWLAEHPIDGNCSGCSDTHELDTTSVNFVKTSLNVTPSNQTLVTTTSTNTAASITVNASPISLNNTSVTILAGAKYQVNTQPTIVAQSVDSNTDITLGSGDGETGNAVVVRLMTNNIPFAEVEANFQNDLDWTTVEGGVDTQNGKAYVAGFADAEGAAPTHSLLIPKVANSTGAYVCPQALTLIEVTENCVGKMEVNSSSNNTSVVTINGIEYWKVDGLTGTGGGNIIAAVNNTNNGSSNNNSSSSSAASSITSALLATTGLNAVQSLGIAFFMLGTTAFVYIARRKSRH